MTLKKRSYTITVSKAFFVSHAYWREITYKKGKGKGPIRERSEEEKEKQFEMIMSQVTDKMINDKMPSLIEYLNDKEGLLCPIGRIEIIN